MASTLSGKAGSRRRHGLAARFFIVITSAMMTVSPSSASLLAVDEPTVGGNSGVVGGVVWVDADGDGLRGADEETLSGVTMVLTGNSTGAVATSPSGDDGAYELAATLPGDYRVEALIPDGYQVSPIPESEEGATSNAFTAVEETAQSETITLASGTELTLNLGLVPVEEPAPEDEPTETTTTTTTTTVPEATTTTVPPVEQESFGPQGDFGILALAPSQQWMTTVGPALTGPGQTMDIDFGTTGVTAGLTAVSNTSVGCGLICWPHPDDGLTHLNNELAGPNIATYIEPDQPAGLPAITTGVFGATGTTAVSTWNFGKPVLAPIIHLINLDAAYVEITGTTTTGAPITLTPIASNAQMELVGNRLNATSVPAEGGGCHLDGSVVAPFAGCGSFRLGGTSGLIESFTITNVVTQTPTGGDGWSFAVSFPSAPLTKTFEPAAVPEGAPSQLTFSITNPNDPEAVTLAPLDFTDTLPSGVTIADTSVSDNGLCGTPTVADGSGDPLAVGATSVQATEISVGVGDTCEITVTVTAPVGTYVNNNDNLTTTVGNLVPDADTTLTVFASVPADFGDAPDSYGTLLADDGARHSITSLMLGATIDPETDGLPGAGADGDDLDNFADEDGVVFATNLSVPGRLETVYVTASDDGFLNAWIDFNLNGVFDPSEQILTDEPVVAGLNRLTYTVPTDGDFQAGDSYARFRLTSEEGQASTPTGLAPDGEVEDYTRVLFDAPGVALNQCPVGSIPVPVSIIQNPSFEDRTGDFVQTGASTINFAEFWQDSHPSGGQYHVFSPTFDSGPGPAVMPVRSGADGYGSLSGHSSGTFGALSAGDFGEGASNALLVPLVPGATYVGYFSMANGGYGRQGDGYMRFFGTSDPNVGHIVDPAVTPPTASNIEVLYDTPVLEFPGVGVTPTWQQTTFTLQPTQSWDYLRVEVRNANSAADANTTVAGQVWMNFDDFHMYLCDPQRDFGDAPDSFGTLLGSGGPYHDIPGYDPDANTAPLMLGSLIDIETDGVPTPGSDGDDAAPDIDDEDAVSGPISFTAGQPTTVPVTLTNNTDGEATLAAWADLNGNGVFDAAERVIVPVTADPGTRSVDVDFGAAFPVCQNVRFRLYPGTVADPSPTGPAAAGEVEDHPVVVEPDCTADDIPLTISGFAQAWTPDSLVQSPAIPASNALNAPDGVGTQLYSAVGSDLTLDLSTVVPEGNAVTIHIAQVGGFEGPVEIAGSADGTNFSGIITHTPSSTLPSYEEFEYVVPAGGARYVRIVPLADASGETAVRVDAVTYSFVTCECEDAVNFVVDGSFEAFGECSVQTGDFGAWSVIDVNIHIWGENCAQGWDSPDGVNSMDLDGGTTGGAEQLINGLTPGNSYNLTFYMAFNPAAGAESSSMRAQIADFDETYTSASNATLGGFNLVHVEFTADSTTELLRFESLTGSGDPNLLNGGGTQGYGVVLDNIRITPMDCDEIPPIFDFGDAPDSYGTTAANNGPSHAIPGFDPDVNAAPLMLGSLIGNEADGQPSPDADADSFDDGVVDPIVLIIGDETVVEVSVTNDTGELATLAGWVDVNDDGVFDPGELQWVEVPASSGTTTQTLTFPAAGLPGEGTYARFRLFPGTFGDPAEILPTGPAGAGEVEDYPVVGPVAVFLQCPIVYALQGGSPYNIYEVDTTTGDMTIVGQMGTGSGTNNGMGISADARYVFSHRNGEVLRYDTFTGVTDTFDGVSGLNSTHGGVDPSSGIFYYGNIASAAVYAFDPATETDLGQVATLSFDEAPAGNNGDWSFDAQGNMYVVAGSTAESALYVVSGLPTTAQTTPVSVTGAQITTFETDGAAVNGIAFDATGSLYAASNAVIFEINPSTGEIISEASLDPSGVSVDLASCSTPATIIVQKDIVDRFNPADQFQVTVTGGGITENNVGTTTGSDTGIQSDPGEFAGPVLGLPDVTYDISETGASGANLANYTTSWVCVNQSDGGATIAEGTGISGAFTMPASTDGIGAAIECTFTNEPIPLDFGDAPNSYGTTLAANGARHGIPDYDPDTNTAPLTLGSLIDSETDGLPGVDADGDDLDGIADEDGVADPIVLSVGDPTTVSVSVTNTTGEVATLAGWIDLDGNGIFDPGELQTLTVPANTTGDFDLVFPAASTLDVSYARFRLFPGDVTGPLPTGLATGGEVEDYRVEISGYEVVKTANPVSGTPVRPGETVTYTLTFTNLGTVDLVGVEAEDDLSGVFDDADLISGPLVLPDGSGTATITGDILSFAGDIPAGGEVTVSYMVSVLDPSESGGDAVLGNVVTSPDSANCPDPAVTDPQDPNFDPDCVTEHPVRHLTIVKSSTPADGSTVAPGDTIIYTLDITNTGGYEYTVGDPAIAGDDLSDVIDDAFYNGDADDAGHPGTIDYTAPVLSWTGPLEVDEVVTVTYTVTVLAGDNLGDGVLENVVTGPDSDCPDPPITDPDDPDYDPDCHNLLPVGAVHYEKTVDPPDPLALQPGDTYTYTVTAANIGTVDLTGLSFTDDLSGVLDDATFVVGSETVDIGTAAFDGVDAVEWSGDLAIGEVATVTYQVTIDNPPGGDSILINGVVGTGPGSNCPPPGPATDADCFKQIPQPLINTVKTSDAAGNVEPGDIVQYEFTVSNTGTGPAHAFEVVDDLSDVLDDATYDGNVTLVTGPGGVVFDPVNQEIVWTGPLVVGEFATVTYSVTVNGPTDLGDGVLLNAVTSPDCFDPPVTDPDDPNFNPDCVPIIPVEAWTGVKTSDAVGSVEPGDTVNYTITVTNTGGVDLTAAQVVNVDDLSEVLDDASYDGNADDGGHPGNFDFTSPTLTWSGDLAVDEVVTLTYSVTVNDATDLGDGELLNAITGSSNCPDPAITDPQDPGFDPDCVPIIPVEAWTAIKTSDAVGNVLPGDTLTYTIELENTGNVALTAVDVVNTDDLTEVLDDASYDGNADDGGHPGTFDFTSPTLTWTGDLAVDETVTLTYSVTVNDADDLGDGELLNAITGSTNCPDPAVTDSQDPDFDPDCVPIIPVAAYTVVKTSDAVDPVLPGDVVEYTVTVTNTGDVDLTGPDAATFDDDLSGVLDDATFNDDESADVGTVTFSDPVIAWSGDLLMDEVATVTYSVTVDQPIGGDHQLVNAVVGGDCPDPAVTDPNANDFDETCVVVDPLPGVDIDKVIFGDPVTELQPGDTFEYVVTVENIGQVDLVGETFSDDLSEVLDDAELDQGSLTADIGVVNYAAPDITWIGDLAIGETATIRYSITIDDPITGDAELLNAVAGSIYSNCVPPDPDDPDCWEETPLPNVVVVKELVGPAQPQPGDVVSYRITAENQGGATAIAEVITDDLSGVVDDAAYNNDAQASLSGALSYTAPTLEWVGDIAAGESLTLTYTVTVNSAGELGDGVLDNAVTGGGTCPEDTEACQTRTPLAAVHYAKTIISPSDGQAQANGMLTYRVTVTNTGQTDLVDASFTDDLTNVLDNSAWIGDADATTGTVSYSQPVLTWTGDLDVGEIAMVSYSVRVDDTIPAGTRLVNRVAGIGPGSNCPEGSTDPACLAATVLSAAALPTLPFTGIEILGLLIGAFVLVIVGAFIRRAGREKWLDETL